MTPSREYAIALQWVQIHYRELHGYAEAIVLTPSHMFPAGQEGQCSHDNFININSGLRTVGDYVNVLVHELTHAKQNRTGSRQTDLEREEEAYEAGIVAAKDYMLKAAPWMKK